MTRIKIRSNPYNRTLEYYIFKEHTESWEDIQKDSINSRLREHDVEKIFFPFKVKEIVDTLIAEYYTGTDKIELIFEGTTDEYAELENVCSDTDVENKVQLKRSTIVLENARDILDHTKEIFEIVHPMIENVVKDDPVITKGMNKVSDAMKDIIPICIFGNYSAGKSTFINSLIGYEILPSGGDPVTAKVFEIKRSKQDDRGKISFEYHGETIELQFDDKTCHVTIGNKDLDIITSLFETMGKIDDVNLFSMMNKAIDIINFFEKRDKEVMEIGNVIKVEVPFSTNGKLGQSRNEFVIFDTPGSNSQTNMDHSQVLSESLEGFSNGIPIWVSQYDSIDSVDNASLCERLYKIDALDKRFTMIVINKADSVELPKAGLESYEINDIMEYESVEKMYSSGIYFVSAVMGLGAKNKDGIISDYLADVFDEKEKKFGDPTARSYKKLYEYNIMPEQMKRRALEYSQECENLIYANSGIYCVEMEMEQFASRHAAYNKCQMVYSFLKSIIDETTKRIEDKAEIINKNKERIECELDSKKQDLVNAIRNDTDSSSKLYEKNSDEFITAYVIENLNYSKSVDSLVEVDNKLAEENSANADFGKYEDKFENAKSERWKKLIENSQNILKGDRHSFVESVKHLATDWASDSKILQEKKKDMDAVKNDVERDTSDTMLSMVVEDYRNHILEAQDKLSEVTKEMWQSNAAEYRDTMIKIITGSDALSEQQRAELSDVIWNYEPLIFDDNADRVFIKAKFLRGNVLGIRLGGSERLDIRRLVSGYNSAIKKNVEEMGHLINKSCCASFNVWQERLSALIEENITIYNPELREMTDIIRDENERIQELHNNQQTILNSFGTIESMMSWKELG